VYAANECIEVKKKTNNAKPVPKPKAEPHSRAEPKPGFSSTKIWAGTDAPLLFEKTWLLTGYPTPDLNSLKRLQSCCSEKEKVEWIIRQFYKERIKHFAQDHPIDALMRLKEKSNRDEELLKNVFDSCGIKKYHQMLYNSVTTHGSLELRLLKKISSKERTGVSYIDFSYDMEIEHLKKMLNFDEKVSSSSGWDPSMFSCVFHPTYVAMLGLPYLLTSALRKHEPVLLFDSSKNTNSDKAYAFYHLLPKKDHRQISVWHSDSSLKHLIDTVLYKLNDPLASIKREFCDILEEAFHRLTMPNNKRDYKIWFDACFDNYDKPALSFELFHLFEAAWLCTEKNKRDEYMIFDYIREIATNTLEKKFGSDVQYFVHPLEPPAKEIKRKKRRRKEGELISPPLGKITFQELFDVHFEINEKFLWFVEFWRSLVNEKKLKTCVRFGI
jgi:hypothetical protein